MKTPTAWTLFIVVACAALAAVHPTVASVQPGQPEQITTPARWLSQAWPAGEFATPRG